jgi:hypothetical protein
MPVRRIAHQVGGHFLERRRPGRTAGPFRPVALGRRPSVGPVDVRIQRGRTRTRLA